MVVSVEAANKKTFLFIALIPQKCKKKKNWVEGDGDGGAETHKAYTQSKAIHQPRKRAWTEGSSGIPRP